MRRISLYCAAILLGGASGIVLPLGLGQLAVQLTVDQPEPSLTMWGQRP